MRQGKSTNKPYQVLIATIKKNVNTNPRLFDSVEQGSVFSVFVELRKRWTRHMKYIFSLKARRFLF